MKSANNPLIVEGDDVYRGPRADKQRVDEDRVFRLQPAKSFTSLGHSRPKGVKAAQPSGQLIISPIDLPLTVSLDHSDLYSTTTTTNRQWRWVLPILPTTTPTAPSLVVPV